MHSRRYSIQRGPSGYAAIEPEYEWDEEEEDEEEQEEDPEHGDEPAQNSEPSPKTLNSSES